MNFLLVDQVHRTTSQPSGVPVVVNALFRLTTRCSILKLFAVKSGSCLKSDAKFSYFWAPKF